MADGILRSALGALTSPKGFVLAGVAALSMVSLLSIAERGPAASGSSAGSIAVHAQTAPAASPAKPSSFSSDQIKELHGIIRDYLMTNPELLAEVSQALERKQAAEQAAKAEKYLVEAVPWTMHFGYRYALHAAYWHWGYGNWASHGCVNLSPRDARMLFERLHPALPDGWHTVYENADDPGSSVRIHWADIPIRDRRKPLGAKWSSADED